MWTAIMCAPDHVHPPPALHRRIRLIIRLSEDVQYFDAYCMAACSRLCSRLLLRHTQDSRGPRKQFYEHRMHRSTTAEHHCFSSMQHRCVLVNLQYRADEIWSARISMLPRHGERSDGIPCQWPRKSSMRATHHLHGSFISHESFLG